MSWPRMTRAQTSAPTTRPTPRQPRPARPKKEYSAAQRSTPHGHGQYADHVVRKCRAKSAAELPGRSSSNSSEIDEAEFLMFIRSDVFCALVYVLQIVGSGDDESFRALRLAWRVAASAWPLGEATHWGCAALGWPRQRRRFLFQ